MIEFIESYFVSETGEVFSNKGKDGSLRELIGKIGKSGYREVLLSTKDGRKYRHVHRLVAEAFIDNPDNKRTVNHIDGNKLNNRAVNLEWATDSENLEHARDSGLLSACKINMDQAADIRIDKRSHRVIAKAYGIGKTQVGYIKKNLRWKV